jgi:hypothetical protein
MPKQGSNSTEEIANLLDSLNLKDKAQEGAAGLAPQAKHPKENQNPESSSDLILQVTKAKQVLHNMRLQKMPSEHETQSIVKDIKKALNRRVKSWRSQRNESLFISTKIKETGTILEIFHAKTSLPDFTGFDEIEINRFFQALAIEKIGLARTHPSNVNNVALIARLLAQDHSLVTPDCYDSNTLRDALETYKETIIDPALAACTDAFASNQCVEQIKATVFKEAHEQMLAFINRIDDEEDEADAQNAAALPHWI